MGTKSQETRHPVHSSPPHYAKVAGFTLMEIMITIVIVGILSAAAFTSFRNLTKRQTFASQVQDVRNLFHKCQAKAVEMGNPASAPTALALFVNGGACFQWVDTNSNHVFDWVDRDGDGVPTAGDDEVKASYLYFRFDESKPINVTPGTGAQITSGDYLTLIMDGGYFVDTNFMPALVTATVDKAPGETASIIPASITVYPSGQQVEK